MQLRKALLLAVSLLVADSDPRLHHISFLGGKLLIMTKIVKIHRLGQLNELAQFCIPLRGREFEDAAAGIECHLPYDHAVANIIKIHPDKRERLGQLFSIGDHLLIMRRLLDPAFCFAGLSVCKGQFIKVAVKPVIGLFRKAIRGDKQVFADTVIAEKLIVKNLAAVPYFRNILLGINDRGHMAVAPVKHLEVAVLAGTDPLAQLLANSRFINFAFIRNNDIKAAAPVHFQGKTIRQLIKVNVIRIGPPVNGGHCVTGAENIIHV